MGRAEGGLLWEIVEGNRAFWAGLAALMMNFLGVGSKVDIISNYMDEVGLEEELKVVELKIGTGGVGIRGKVAAFGGWYEVRCGGKRKNAVGF